MLLKLIVSDAVSQLYVAGPIDNIISTCLPNLKPNKATDVSKLSVSDGTNSVDKSIVSSDALSSRLGSDARTADGDNSNNKKTASSVWTRCRAV